MINKVLTLLLCMSDILLLLTYGQGNPADSCEKQINTCACKTAKGYINLENLDNAKSGGTPKYTSIVDYNGNSYSYNPCSAYTTGQVCTNVAACQTQYGVDYDIGTQDQATFATDATLGSTIIKYTATDGARSSRVKLLCDPTQEGSLTADGESQTTIYDFTLTTKWACSDIAPPPSGSGGSGGLSAGSVLLIIFFVVLAVYIIAGMMFMRFRKGASGIELVPNIEFWKALPGLAKDGVLFTKDKILGLFNQSKSSASGYEKY